MALPNHFKQQCRGLRAATLLVFAGLALLLCIGASSTPWLPGAGSEVGGGNHAVLMLVRLLPGVGYLWALWAVQRVLGELGSGRMFHAVVARAIRHIGLGVLSGALLSVFAVTNLSRLLMDGKGGFAYFDLSGIVLGVVGAALILLAHVVDQARHVQAELDEIL